MALQQFAQALSEFDNVLITDEKGCAIFYDLADLNILLEIGLTPDEFFQKTVTDNYQNLSTDTSTIFKVLRTGEPIIYFEQVLTTLNGFSYKSLSSTYPIIEKGEVIGAIEFSKHFYESIQIKYLDHFHGHKLYRDNYTNYRLEDLIAVNAEMKAQIDKARRGAKKNSSILITGETGTGKEIIAQGIHNESERFTKPYIVLNCATLTEDNIFSQLYGFEAEGKIGKLQEANGGTLLIDQLNTLDLALQAKLLHAVDLKMFNGEPLDVRYITTVNEDVDQLLMEKRLREDLFYRLNVMQIDLPPLQMRKEDIPAILDFYIEFYNEHTIQKDVYYSDEVLQLFYEYHWPGNVRELKNALETAYNNLTGQEILVEHIPERIVRTVQQKAQPAMPNIHSGHLRDLTEAYERLIIAEKLRETEGRLAETARRLGISRQLLKYKCLKYELL
ncbi:sigma 54-interacting transcriptional regulator [Lysinibacillus sp. NPDC097195]|uniref:sigma 54-interacting transcriptional regulator n=1 Tax=Lysinibacillus sp. NPDC097195 TaxID=3364141 RepID=UPI00382B79D2